MTEIAPEADVNGAPDPLAPDEDAPYGYTVDRATGTRRPKKTPGRPKADSDGGDPSTGDLKSGAKVTREEDRAPARAKVRAKKGSPFLKDRKPKEPVEVPPFRAGPIAKGMNGLYAKAGKIIRVMDPEVGSAIISATRKVSDDDVTVGEAWEEIAKVNPRVRAALLKLITGGAWSQLLMAHAPIFMAVLMKPQVARHIPFNGLVDAVLTEDDGTASAEAEMMGGLRPEDVQQMAGFAEQMAEQMAAGGIDLGAMMRGMAGMPREPEAYGPGAQYEGFTPPEEGNA